MPRIDIIVKDLDVTSQQLAALLKSPGQILLTQVLPEEPPRANALFSRGTLAPSSYREAPVENPRQYLRTPGTKQGAPGRPHKFTTEGLKKIWDLHREGYTNSEISNGFQKLIGAEAVRRLIKKIKESK